MNIETQNDIWRHFDINKFYSVVNKNKILENSNYLNSILSDVNIKNKDIFIDNLKYLSQIYYINNELYNDNILYNKKNNKLLNNKLIEILYNYNNYKKNLFQKIDINKLIIMRNIVYVNNKEESIMHLTNTIMNNCKIIDFIK